MSFHLRALLVPRRLAGMQFTLYELIGLLVMACMSLAIGLSFLHDSAAVTLGIVGASLFNGIACYIVGVGIGRFSGRHLNANNHLAIRFSVRDMLWLTAVVAVLVAWRVDRGNWKQDQALLRQIRGEFMPISGRLRWLEESRKNRAEQLTRLTSALPAAPSMSDERIEQIDRNLEEHDWTYNPAAEQFEFLMSGGPGNPRFAIDWEAIVVALPDLSVNEMLTYQQQKRQQLLREQAEGRSQ